MTTDIDYSRQYMHWHDDSAEHAQQQADGYRPYLDRWALPKDSKVLDIGCGRGFFLRAAQQYGFASVLGIDTSPQQIESARRHGMPAELVDDTPAWLAAHPSSFDAIFMFDVLEHIRVEQQIDAVRGIHGALKDGGMLLMRVPNASSSFAGRYRWIDWTHYCSFTEYSLDFVLYNGGFRDIAVHEDYFGRWPIWFPRPNLQGLLRSFHFGVRRLQAIAEFGRKEGGAMPLTLNIVGVARK